MNAFDLTGVGGKPKRFGCDAQEARRLVQSKPWLLPVRCWPEYRDFMMRPERRDAFAGPAVAVARHQSVAIEDAGNQIIIGNEHQLTNGGDDVGGGAMAPPTASLG